MSDSDRQERVVRYLASTQERLLRYVYVLFPDWDGAQEIVQNTHVVVWKKSAEFESDSEDDFFRWIKRIGYFEVKKYVEQQQKKPAMLGDALLRLIADEMDEMDGELELQREALATCIDKLPPRNQELLRLRYWHADSIADLSNRLGRSVEALYKSLQRIRRSLLECIERESRRLRRTH